MNPPSYFMLQTSLCITNSVVNERRQEAKKNKNKTEKADNVTHYRHIKAIYKYNPELASANSAISRVGY